MLRKTGGIGSIASAILCVGVIVLWVRSRNHADVILIQTPSRQVAGIASYRGGLLFAQSDLLYEGAVSQLGEDRPVAFMSVSPDDFAKFHDTIFDTTAQKFSFAGFKTAAGMTTLSSQVTPRFSAIMLPAWFPAAVFAILPLGVGKTAWMRFQRKRKGLCIGCGYDMRASEGRCPECGREKAVAGNRRQYADG